MPMKNAKRSFRPGFFRVLSLVWIFAALGAADATAQEPLELNLRRLSDRVLLTWHCDQFQGTNMGVITTEDGLVIIDTGLSPSLVARQRQRVESELGRSDFRYLINTHMHNDHAFANSVFPEATVVGSVHSAAALQREVELIPELLERLRRSRGSYAEWAAETSPDSTEGRYAREGVAAFDIGIADLERGIEPRFPTTTFAGHHAMDVGDVRIELFEFTGFHSDSDILILVPGERLLFTGDVFWGGQLPVLRVRTTDELERLLGNWSAILERSPDLEYIVPGHSDVPLTVEQFRGMYAYVSRLWADVRAAKPSGTPMVRFLMGNVFAERYPEVAAFNHVRREYNLHQHNIYVLWSLAES
jgi:glyoxylase-like metal-dependent hydrolase (beta-lactamase superfamily II)